MHAAYSTYLRSDGRSNVEPRYNITPTQDVTFFTDREGEQVVMEGMWWLVPFWAKEKPKYPTFNARSETAHEKSSFRDSFKSKRCLIPASGYYEWTKNADDMGKDPWHIQTVDREPFAFAGLWAHNSRLDITSCTILTAPAHPAIEHLHHRMPLILRSEDYGRWCSADTAIDVARELLANNRGEELTGYRVDRAVNSNKAQGPELIEPIAA